MKRIKSLNRYQKGILLFMAVMALVFAVVYSMMIDRVGFAYEDEILMPSQENDTIVYSGKIKGKQADFKVFQDKTVEFQYDGKTYGPYIAREDSTAIPKEGEAMTGVELRCGEEILFRGGVLDKGEFFELYHEDGSIVSTSSAAMTNNGIVTVENENVKDTMAPSVHTILELMGNPVLTHRGEWMAWFCGVFICIVNGISILFADELFRWQIFFRVRDVERIEPSDWEVVCRNIVQTGLTIMAMLMFIIGLQ